MIFYAAFTAIGVYASAFYVWGIMWDALEKLLRRKAPQKTFREDYEKKYPRSDPRNADAWEEYYNSLAPSPSFEEAYKAKCIEIEQRKGAS